MLINRARDFYERSALLRSSRAAGYGFALGSVTLALAARFMLAGQAGGFPFLTFIPAVFVTSFVCGWRAGAVAAVLGTAVHWYFYVPVTPTTAVNPLLGFSLYTFAVLVILAMIAAMHLAFRDFAASEALRERLNAELERRVGERTVALEMANQRLLDEAASRATAEASRAAAQAQVRQMQKMEAIGQLTGGIAHDFNNMLAIVVGSLDIARRQLGTDDEKAGRFIATALEAAQRGAQLTSRLLAFSRQQPLDPRPLDPNQLMREMSELLKRTIGENIRLSTALSDESWRTHADASQLESAVINLCVNSRDAMPNGGTLTLGTANATFGQSQADENADAQPGEYVVISVADTGTGMTPEVVTRAFDPFYTTKSTGNGTGLGLSQVYGFVKQSGGHVRIESDLGAGTTVRLYLPRYTGALDPPPAAARDRIQTAANRELILVVEDEDGLRGITVEALRSLGYSVIAAADPEEALALMQENVSSTLHLLFTDVVMPGMNGRALAQRIKALRPQIKVLYTTGYTRDARLHESILERDAPFLQKPFTIDQLAAKVRGTLDAPPATDRTH